jgi:hypothetical protein
MHDDLSPLDGREDALRPRVPERSKVGNTDSPMVDREVPIELTRTPDVVHAWLDGEVPESSVRGAEGARHVEFWKHLDRDLEVRRQMHAPTGLADRIMSALPATAPRAAVSWRNRPVTMNPVAVAAAAAGLLALGAAIGAAMR